MSILINKDTKVITQGITGKTGQFHTEKCQEYANGKNCFVAGVNPKKAGESIFNIPIYASVKEAAQQMLYLEVHRLFVEDDGRLVGVISQSDIVRAVALARI